MKVSTTTLLDLDGFAACLREIGDAENTINTYLQHLSDYDKWYRQSFAEPAPKVLLRPTLLDYRSYLSVLKKLKAQSINSHLSALRSYNEYLVIKGLQDQIVIMKRDYIKCQVEYASPSKVTCEQIEQLRQKVLTNDGIRDYAVVTLMAYGGLRISEACSAKIDNLDLISGELRITNGKGNKTRIVYLNEKIINALREYLSVRPHTQEPYIFISREGGPLDRTNFNKLLKKYSAVITPHMLRHFYCSNALDHGMTIAEVANQAGHSNVRTTLRYTNPTVQSMKDKLNQM